jgi:hypothetical protein
MINKIFFIYSFLLLNTSLIFSQNGEFPIEFDDILIRYLELNPDFENTSAFKFLLRLQDDLKPKQDDSKPKRKTPPTYLREVIYSYHNTPLSPEEISARQEIIKSFFIHFSSSFTGRAKVNPNGWSVVNFLSKLDPESIFFLYSQCFEPSELPKHLKEDCYYSGTVLS